MVDPSTLSIFMLAVLTLFLSPGPNMAFVLSQGIANGPRGGFAAALGITAADLTLTLLTASGVTGIVAAWPASFEVLRYLCVIYLLWLAIQAIRLPGKTVIRRHGYASLACVFRMAMTTSLLNPKALLFFIVFLPQFVVVSHGHVALQLTVLGCTLSFSALLFNSVLGAFGGQVGNFLSRSPLAARYHGWFLGGILSSLAVRLILLERPLAR